MLKIIRGVVVRDIKGRKRSILSTLGLASVLILGAPNAAQAACGTMDLGRDPSSFVYISWKTGKLNNGKTFTSIMPQHGAGGKASAVVARYSGGKVIYFQGPGVSNTNYDFVKGGSHISISYIDASTGSPAGHYYRYSTSGSHLGKLYDDYKSCHPILKTRNK